jgi:exosortase/archaeosortase family protein
MKQFIILYTLFLAILFSLLYADTSIVSIFLNEKQREITLFFLDMLLEPNRVYGIDIIINPHYKIIITKACNGVIPILFLWSSILAYPSKLRDKIVWLIIGYIAFTIVNIFRILMVVHIVKGGRDKFYLAHDILGNSILMSVGVILFILFIKSIKKSQNGR